MKVLRAKNLPEDVGFRVFCTTRKMGNFRFPDLDDEELAKKLLSVREATWFEGLFLAPFPNNKSNILIWTNGAPSEYFEHSKGFYRTAKKGREPNDFEGCDGALLSEKNATAYMLASADSPVGVFYGVDTEGQKIILCVSLNLDLLRYGILKTAIMIAGIQHINLSGFFYAFGVGPEVYQMSLNHPKYGDKNKKTLEWLHSIGVCPKENGSSFGVDLFDISKCILWQRGFKGKISRDTAYPCTALAVDEKNKSLFFSATANPEDRKNLNRHAIIVTME